MAEADGSLIERLAACPLCGCAELTRVGAPPVGIGRDVFAAAAPQLGLSRCAECRLVFVNPRPAPPLLNAFYDRDGYDCHNPHFAAHGAEGDLRARFAALVPHVKRKGTLLDFGAGAGHLMRYAQREGWPRVLGVEVGARARAALRREGLEVYADLEEARESKAQLDALTMIQVLEHLTTPHEILRGLRDLLQPDGVFLVEVPNADSLRARLALSFLKPLWTTNVERYLAFPIHLSYFNPRSLCALLERTGFEVLSLTTIGMGVEELRAAPSAPAGEGPQTDAAAAPAAPPSGGAKRAAKQVVKDAMSAFRLGEQLLAVCRKS